MLNKIILLIFMVMTKVSLAIPIVSNMPIFSDFEPKVVSQFYSWLTSTPDSSRENRMVNQISDAVMDGDVESLTLQNGEEVFSIFMEPEADTAKGGVIILHNRGHHANWVDTIRPLRIGLADKGWETLSVQMPVLNKQAKYYDYVPIFPYANERIRAAIAFYKARGINNIVLIAHGCGAHMAMNYFERYGDKDISQFVGIGMGATDFRQKLIRPYPLERLRIPVLDIFAERDFAGVRRLAAVRAPRLKAGNAKNAQIVIPAAGHYYVENNSVQTLINSIDGWLSRD